jgi:hydroxylysine kinase
MGWRGFGFPSLYPRRAGKLLADVAHPPALLHAVGAAVGRMDAALAGFTHASLARPLVWDLARVLGVRAFTAHVAEPGGRELAEAWLAEFEARVLPCAASLPTQV